MIYRGQWDYNRTCYPIIDKWDEKSFYLNWVYADANGGAAEAPLAQEDEDGDEEILVKIFPTLEEAMAHFPGAGWVKVEEFEEEEER